MKNNGSVYWITGLSGAGKTTLGKSLFNKIQESQFPVVMLDGDDMRIILGVESSSLYSREERLLLAEKYSRLTKYLSEQGVNVVVATISMFKEIYDWNRKNIDKYVEIFLDVPIEELKKRDVKGIYGGQNSDTNQVAGISVRVDEPKDPSIHLLWEANESEEDIFERLCEGLALLEESWLFAK